MKKLITIILILALALPALALADLPDISGLSYDELVQLKDRINLAMWNSQEWQEVIVPVGVWEIGKDIPVGEWDISVASDSPNAWGTIIYCDKLDGSGLGANQLYCKIYHYEQLFSKNYENALRTSITIDFKPGTFLIVDYGDMLFTPPIGKPSLGFK